MEDLVSVIVPCYNAEKYIHDTLSSILAQDYRPLELIVVNDGSTDATSDTVQLIADKEPGLKIISIPNGGVSNARNLGLQQALGAYICFFDADDLMLPGFLSTRVSALVQDPEAVMALTAYDSFDSTTGQVLAHHTPVPSPDYTWQMMCRRPGALYLPSNVMHRRANLAEMGPWDDALSVSADLDFAIRASHGRKVITLPQVTLRYRIHEGQMHHNVAKMTYDTLYINRKLKRLGILTPASYRYIHARTLLGVATWHVKDVWRPVAGIKFLLQSIWHSPRPLLQRLAGQR